MVDREILERFDRVDEKLDRLTERFDEHRVQVQGRLTKVEVKSGVIAAIAGFLSGFLGGAR